MHTNRNIAIQYSNNAAGGSTGVLSVAEVLSKQNYRKYSQGGIYKGKISMDNNIGSSLQVFVLVETWWLCKAWKLAKSTYNKALKEERKMLGKGKTARWQDFRVNHGFEGANPLNGMIFNATTNPTGWSAITQGEHDISRIDAEGTSGGKSFTFGPHSAVASAPWSIIAEFDRKYNTAATPQVLEADEPYREVTDLQMSELDYDEAQDNGNLPPYAQGTLPQAVWVKVATLDGNAGESGRTSTGMFTIPFGFVAITNTTGGLIPDGSLRFEAAPGNYKGVYMEAC